MSADFRHAGFRLDDFQVRPLDPSVGDPERTQHVQADSVDVLLCLSRKPEMLVDEPSLTETVPGEAID